jgi:hypothetical protein
MIILCLIRTFKCYVVLGGTMKTRTGRIFGWLVVALLLGANVAFASGLGAANTAASAKWTCGKVIGPGGGEEPVCINYMYEECSCSYCVLDC